MYRYNYDCVLLNTEEYISYPSFLFISCKKKR